MPAKEYPLNLTFEVHQEEDHYLLEAKLTGNKDIVDNPELIREMKDCSLMIFSTGCKSKLESGRESDPRYLPHLRVYFSPCEEGYKSEKVRITPRPEAEDPFSGLEVVLLIKNEFLHWTPIKDLFSPKK